jgi:signal transduction histidine kinase
MPTRLKPVRVNAEGLIYGFWACSSGLILAGALLAWSSLRARDRYIQELLGLIDSAREPEHNLHDRAKELCNECQDRTNAGGLALYANTTNGLRKMVQSGDSAEVTGPGVVRDLLLQTMNSGASSEAVQGGRFLLSLPVPATEGAALLLFWEDEERPDEVRRSLLDMTARLFAFVIPGLQSDMEILKLHDEVKELKASAQSELEEIEQEMGEEHHLASVGRLAAGVAHELNTPLGAVLTMVGSLLRKEEDAKKQKKLSIVKEAVEKCKDIINKLLVYSRSPVQTETGLTFSRFVRADMNLNTVISGIGEMMSEEFKKKSIELELNLGDLPPLRANGSQWSHVFTNLIANARDALLENKVESPKITVTSALVGKKMVVSVADNGPGVPEAHRGKIFEPFFTTKEVGHGTGLGLAICREIVRKHKGDIVIKEADNGGALFEITLDPAVLEAEGNVARLPQEQYP